MITRTKLNLHNDQNALEVELRKYIRKNNECISTKQDEIIKMMTDLNSEDNLKGIQDEEKSTTKTFSITQNELNVSTSEKMQMTEQQDLDNDHSREKDKGDLRDKIALEEAIVDDDIILDRILENIVTESDEKSHSFEKI